MKVIYRSKALSILCIICSIFIYTACSVKEDNATTLFYNSITSIIEVKAENAGSTSYGTAVLINHANEIFIVTNAHVVCVNTSGGNICSNTYIRFADDEDYQSVVITHYDMQLDLALLELVEKTSNKKANGLKACTNTDYGEVVYAIGNAMNQGISITSGIISNPSVNIYFDNCLHNAIQANITIESGNSGGALLNKKGELIGITSFRLFNENGTPIYGFSYAIPSSDIIAFINNR